ncbi:group II intron reverse transcriptase/maturase [Mesorhizobium sp. M0437]|uniref:group II intron reverse transcriptase/maturase n=1 Tax=Mesorhizobium sp. M0437 TaxID=2956945 RepID=UPI00333546A1
MTTTDATDKPFMIDKRLVYEAYKAVKSNGGAAGVDGQTIEQFEADLKGNLYKIWNRMSSGSYFPPPVRAVPIPKKSGEGQRILGVPTVSDRIAQMVVKQLIKPDLDQIFLKDSYGYRPGKSALVAVGVTRQRCWKYDWVLEFDIKGLFGSLSHEWMLRFVEHRVGDPRLISLIRRWLKAGVMEDGAVHPSDEGTPQGGSISVLLSNVYLHYVLDLWFERVVKVRLKGEARLVRYIDDFVICFQHQSDALQVQEALRHRLGRFGLTLEPTKTKLVEFGRFAQRDAGKRGRSRPETIYFLGMTLYCSRNLKGNFKVGMRTEKSRLRRSISSAQELMRRIRHYGISDQVSEINAAVRGHYAYYGIAGNLRSLLKVHRVTERYWCRMLRSRSRDGGRLTWDTFNQIKERNPILRPKLRLPYRALQALAVL